MADIAPAVNDAPASSGASATFEQAFASDASPASATPEQSNSATAAAQPATTQEQPQQDDERSPFIPRARFNEVNERMKAAEEWRKSRAWAEQLDEAHYREMAQWYQRADQDPITFATEYIAGLQQHPTYGPQLRSLAARTLAQGRGQTEEQEPAPNVAITDAQGNVVGHTYDAETLAKRDAIRDARLIQQVVQQVEQRFSPVVKTVEQVQAERTKAAAEQFGRTAYDQLKSLPQFEQHKADIAKALEATQLPPDASEELVLMAAKAAYAQVVLPRLQSATTQQAQSQLLDNLHQKAAASSVNPGSAAPTSPRRIDSFYSKDLQW